MVQLQCSLSAQDCPKLFGPSATLHKLPYTSQSCVRDPRLLGSVGRCGFPGAACVVDSLGNDNCAFGGDSTIAHYTPLCQNGICGGGLGAVCVNGDYDCNWGYYCNTTYPDAGVCGGKGSFVTSQGDIDVDFVFDYCLSGKATQSSTGKWYCDGEETDIIVTPITSSSTIVSRTSFSSSFSTTHTITPIPPIPIKGHRTPTALIAGVSAGVVVIFILVVGFLLWWRFNQKRRLLGAANLGPISHPFPQSPNSPGGFKEKHFSSEMPAGCAAPTFTYLPEVQHDPNAVRNVNYPSTALPTTPTSPAFAYSSSNASPNSTPSPYTSSYGSPIPANPADEKSTQFSSGGNLDAMERHLLEARMAADRELAKMQGDGR